MTLRLKQQLVLNTAYKIKFGNTINQNGIVVSGTGGTTFTVEKPGIYNISFTGQKERK